MDNSQAVNIEVQELEALAIETDCDFAAWAVTEAQGRKTRWRHSYGERSSRLARMELKTGVGIGGMAIRLGVPYLASALENAHMLAECPVMLAERLSAGIAFPLPGRARGQGVGVLLLGRREPIPFVGNDIRTIAARLPIPLERIERSGGWRYDGESGTLPGTEGKDNDQDHYRG